MLGALIIDKPAGLTSHDVVARVRHLLHERRVGHTGTLDPFATGVLVVLVGRATRLAQFLNGLEKEYEAVIRLGFATDTGDFTGTQLTKAPVPVSAIDEQKIETALSVLRGEIEQVPPMYSAKKLQGKKLYELARRGQTVERQPLRVRVREFEPINRSGELLKDNLDGTFDLMVRVVCSAGTYVRTLAEDFGKQLGVGAHLAELRRTRVGHFQLTNAVTLERLQRLVTESGVGKILVPAFDTVSHLEKFQISEEDVKRVVNGMSLQVDQTDWANDVEVRLQDAERRLVAIARFDTAHNTLRPVVVIPEEL